MLKKALILFISVFIVSVFLYQKPTYSWGFYAHKRINRMAVFTLPSEMIGFYKKHLEFITEHAVDPDKRRYAVDGEAPRHYIDIDHYAPHGEDPFEVVPRYWKDAVEKFTEDTLQAYGIVPWHLEVMLKRLTYAFKDKNVAKILRTSAEIGHYIGDAHVPLHTTENYNGQLTGQKGIHGFWESRIPELKADHYNYFVGKAFYLKNVNDYIWETVKGSFNAKDSVLEFEAKLNAEFPKDKKYAFETRGNITVKTYSKEYTEAYNNMLNGMVEKRMARAILSVGCFWYTAWVNAGKPDLNNLNGEEVTEEDLEADKALDNQYKQGKIKGREHQD